MSLRLTCLSGLGGKRPACFMVEGAGARLLLDFGEGPQPGLLPPLERLAGLSIDAVLISHQHPDHIDGLKRLSVLGHPPVYATDPVGRAIVERCGIPYRSLTLGQQRLHGFDVTTGRDGHAPGGVWLHIAHEGESVLYMGDHSDESLLFPLDAPPPAEVAIIDASYGKDDTPQAGRLREILDLLAETPFLLPVPPSGRGIEIPVAMEQAGLPLPALCPVVRAAAINLLERDGTFIRPETRESLKRIVAVAPEALGPGRVTLAAGAMLDEGPAVRLAAQWCEDGQPILLTGHVPPDTPAADLLERKIAVWRRWNVHSRLSDAVRIARHTKARIVVPAFGRLEHREAWSQAFSPALLWTEETPLELSSSLPSFPSGSRETSS